VRVALGATRWHLIRQTLTESLMLAFGGCVLGVPLAFIATEGLTDRVSLAQRLLARRPEAGHARPRNGLARPILEPVQPVADTGGGDRLALRQRGALPRGRPRPDQVRGLPVVSGPARRRQAHPEHEGIEPAIV
jgi:hypothetical protein